MSLSMSETVILLDLWMSLKKAHSNISVSHFIKKLLMMFLLESVEKAMIAETFYQVMVKLRFKIGILLMWFVRIFKDDQTEENTFEILQHSDRNINNS